MCIRDRRTVEYTITAGSQTIMRTRTEQNSGPEAAMYDETITVPAGVGTLNVEVCSPRVGGDSFGIGAVSVSSEDCVPPCPSTFNPGTIEGGFVNCGSYTPNRTFPTGNEQPASNCVGNVTYQWVYTINFNSYFEIPGATGRTLTANQLSNAFGGAINQTIWLRRRAMCEGCPDFEETEAIDIHINRNFTDPGTIEGGECICSGDRPSRIDNIEEPSGEVQSTSSALEVIWQSRPIGGPWVNELEFVSSNNGPEPPYSFRPGTITQTRQYRRCVRIRPCDDFLYSNIVTIEVDLEDPVLSGVPADVTVSCDMIPSPASPTASDNCDDNVSISLSETDTQGNPNSCNGFDYTLTRTCLLYTSPSPRDATLSRMPSSA